MENRDLYVVTEYEEPSAPDVPPDTESSQLAQSRLDVMVQLLAHGACFAGSVDGAFDDEMRAEAKRPHVLLANLTELLSAGNPDDAAAIQHVIDSTSKHELENQLADALDSIEQRGLNGEQMLQEIEELGEEAERLNGFLPFDTQIEGDEALREHVTDIVGRFGLEVDTDLFDQDEDAFWDDFNDAQYKSVGHRFHVLSGYLVILHSMCVAELCYPNRPLSDEQESAVEKIGETYGLKLGDWWSGKKVASMRVNQLMKARSSDSITRRILNSILDRITLSFGR